MPDDTNPQPGGITPEQVRIDAARVGDIALPPPKEAILDEAGQTGGGSFTQRAGMTLARWVGSLGAIVTLIVVIRWVWMSRCISCPNISSTATADQAKALLENYKAIQDQAVQSATQMFDAVIVKVLLPVFTGILGYIFGERSSGAAAGDSTVNDKAG